jgi:hypothetical protein
MRKKTNDLLLLAMPFLFSLILLTAFTVPKATTERPSYPQTASSTNVARTYPTFAYFPFSTQSQTQTQPFALSKAGRLSSSPSLFVIYVRMDVVGTRINTVGYPTCSFTEEYGTVTLSFFADAAATIPVSVSNFPVNMSHVYNFDASSYSTNFTAYCSGFSTVIDNDMLTFYDDGCEGHTSTEYYNIYSSPAYVVL